jgi:hypothetical protein
MKLNCAQAQELLTDEQISPAVKQHVSECYRCSDIAKGLLLLSAGMGEASRIAPPSTLNDSVLSFLEDQPTCSSSEVTTMLNRRSYDFRASHLCLMLLLVCCALPLVINFIQSPDAISLTAMSIVRKNFVALTQVAIFSIGTLCLFFSSLRKGLVIAVVASTLILTQIINVALR